MQDELTDSLMETLADNPGLFEFSVSGLIAGLIFGAIGLWMFRRGKQRSNYKIIGISIALMFYPYITRGPLADWGVGFALCGLAYYIWDT